MHLASCAQRMLAHRVGQYYGLQTSTVDYEENQGRVVAVRTESCANPKVREWYSASWRLLRGGTLRHFQRVGALHRAACSLSIPRFHYQRKLRLPL